MVNDIRSCEKINRQEREGRKGLLKWLSSIKTALTTTIATDAVTGGVKKNKKRVRGLRVLRGEIFSHVRSVRRPTALLSALGLCSILLAGCGRPSGESHEQIRLQGAGATFPNPLYQKWFSEYNKITPNAKFDYQSIGSGGGIKQISARTIDFGGSDPPMNDEQLKSAPGEILHIPTVLGAVVVSYNVAGVQTELKFTPEALVGIFLGKIKKWNDALIASSNPGVRLPGNDITLVHRSDGSGTTSVWTDYLSKVSSEWKKKVGAGTSVNWPAGIGAKGNEGVTGQVKQTPYSIGYVELIYAAQNKLPYASIQNPSGEFVKPSLESITAAAAATAAQMPDDLRISITNAPGKSVYPLSSFTYILVYKEQQDPAKGKALVDFLWWATHDGQPMAKGLLYAPLPQEVVQKVEQKIKSITHEGKPLRRAAALTPAPTEPRPEGSGAPM